jgi:hypothetical protein
MKNGEGILKKYPTFLGEAFCSAWSSKAKGTDTFTLNSPEHGSGKKRSHPAYL